MWTLSNVSLYKKVNVDPDQCGPLLFVAGQCGPHGNILVNVDPIKIFWSMWTHINNFGHKLGKIDFLLFCPIRSTSKLGSRKKQEEILIQIAQRLLKAIAK